MRDLGLLLMALIATACSNGATTLNCIHPPQTSVDLDQKRSIEIAASLEKLEKTKGEGTVKLEFQKNLKQNFDKLSDANASLFLFLEAIECYLQHGAVGERVAQEMAQIVRAWWSAKNGLMGGAGPLTPRERDLITRGSNSDGILGHLSALGIQVR